VSGDKLPASVRRDTRRILDRAARRMLGEKLNAENGRRVADRLSSYRIAKL
jgi:hypothetical protein